jgi:hypothetical protein
MSRRDPLWIMLEPNAVVSTFIGLCGESATCDVYHIQPIDRQKFYTSTSEVSLIRLELLKNTRLNRKSRQFLVDILLLCETTRVVCSSPQHAIELLDICSRCIRLSS